MYVIQLVCDVCVGCRKQTHMMQNPMGKARKDKQDKGTKTMLRKVVLVVPM